LPEHPAAQPLGWLRKLDLCWLSRREMGRGSVHLQFILFWCVKWARGSRRALRGVVDGRLICMKMCLFLRSRSALFTSKRACIFGLATVYVLLPKHGVQCDDVLQLHPFDLPKGNPLEDRWYIRLKSDLWRTCLAYACCIYFWSR
jgi:hypothetical protein